MRVAARRGRQSSVATTLDRAARLDSSPNRVRRFAIARVLQQLRRNRAERDVHVDAVSQWAGQATSIPHNLSFAARAHARRFAGVSAWTRIHRGDQRKARWERDTERRACNRDASVLERLT